MTRAPISPLRPSRRRPQRSVPGKVAHLLPMLGIVEEADHGAWTARTFGGVELGTLPIRFVAKALRLVPAGSDSVAPPHSTGTPFRGTIDA